MVNKQYATTSQQLFENNIKRLVNSFNEISDTSFEIEIVLYDTNSLLLSKIFSKKLMKNTINSIYIGYFSSLIIDDEKFLDTIKQLKTCENLFLTIEQPNCLWILDSKKKIALLNKSKFNKMSRK